MTWWLEDAVPGATIAHPRGRTITPDEHARLAWLTDNASAVHGDAHRAADGAFGQVVVLGALTVAIVLGLAEPAVAEPALAGRAAPTGWRRISLTAAVLGGDTISAVSHIHAVQPDDGGRGGLVHRTVEGLDQHGRVVARIEEQRWSPARW